MKMRILHLFLFLNICILTSCNSQININKYIDKNAPLELRINKIDSLTGFISTEQLEIPVNSDKFIQLTQWADNNTTGWRSTPASCIAEVYVGQGNFRLLYTTGTAGVVIGFTNKENKPRQYSKKTKIGELDFLVN
jgi:hypothetical protein